MVIFLNVLVEIEFYHSPWKHHLLTHRGYSAEFFHDFRGNEESIPWVRGIGWALTLFDRWALI